LEDGVSIYRQRLINRYLIPALIFLFAITAYPFVFSIYQSFHNWILYKPQLGSPFVGFDQYVRLFTDPLFWNALKRTLIYVLISVSCSIMLGFLQALALSRDEIKGKGIIRSIMIIPLVISPVVAGFAFRFMYNTDLGVLPWLASRVGINITRILGDPHLALYAVILVDIWCQSPLPFLVLLAGIQGINPELYEVAAIDGGSYLQSIRYITIPLLSKSFLVVLLIRAIDAFKAFDVLYVMTEGGPGRATEVMSMYGYHLAFDSWRIGTASAFALILFYIVVAISTLFIRMQKGDE
jgi:multiple sugar transport system permease protein